MKTCRKCLTHKDADLFESGRRICKDCRREDHKKTYEANKDKYKMKAKDWLKNNPEKYKEYQKASRLNRKPKARDYYLRRRFGITLETFEQMSAEQNHTCKICGQKELTYKNLNVDHCHETGKIRGLLCTSCNTALGLLKDNLQNLQNAIRYLTDAM